MVTEGQAHFGLHVKRDRNTSFNLRLVKYEEDTADNKQKAF